MTTGEQEDRQGPLKGLRIIDLTHVMAGPTCTLMLADMGADVIKVEKVPEGDDTRRSLPPAIGQESAAFMMMNRNKRGIALDLKTEGGRRVLKRLLADADVVVENYRPGTMAKLGFDYEDLRIDNPGLIYCALSGFGRSGPYGHRGGFDLVAQAMSGLMSITGEGPGRAPVKCGAPVTDITCGILAALGIVSAYTHRLKTGRGQMVDTSLLEAGIIQTYWQSAIALATGEAPGPMGSAHPLNAPYQAFETADGWIVIGGSNQRNWLRTLEALDAAHLADDPRFVENQDRMAHLDELEEALAPYFKQRSSANLLRKFEEIGVPAGPVYDVLQMQADPQVRAREMVTTVEHDREGEVETIGLPIKFSDTPGKVRNGAPLYGQHSREVLREAGFGEEALAALLAEGAVVASDWFSLKDRNLMKVRVRDIERTERDWLLALNNDAVPHVSHLERESLDDLLEMACYARLASIDDQPLGALLALWPGTAYQSANYRWFSQRYEDFLYVDRVMVADGARGKGVGQAFYDDLERFARGGEYGSATSIVLEVNSLPPNPVSMRFHQAAGFIEVGEQVHDGGAKKVVMMMKPLGSAPGSVEG